MKVHNLSVSVYVSPEPEEDLEFKNESIEVFKKQMNNWKPYADIDYNGYDILVTVTPTKEETINSLEQTITNLANKHLKEQPYEN